MFQEQPYLPLGEGTPVTHTLEILIMLAGAFLLGLLLGWALWQRYKKMAAESAESSERYRIALETLQREHASLRYRYDELDRDQDGLRIQLQQTEADRQVLRERVEELEARGPVVSAPALVEAVAELHAEPLEASAAGAGSVAPVAPAEVRSEPPAPVAPLRLPPLEDAPYRLENYFPATDFQIFTGIDAATEVALHGAGYEDWAALAKAKPKQLTATLDLMDRAEQLEPLRKQAKLAADGKWSELIHYQKTQQPEETEIGSPAHLETYYLMKLGFGKYSERDLQIFEGIGATTEGMLKGSGIQTWQQLASASPEQLRNILEKAGSRMRLARPETWVRQAQLAVEGSWAKLRAYQEVLQV